MAWIGGKLGDLLHWMGVPTLSQMGNGILDMALGFSATILMFGLLLYMIQLRISRKFINIGVITFIITEVIRIASR